MKRNRYSDDIPYHCNTCGTDFPVEGYYEPDGEGGTIIVPARRGEVLCPNDGGYVMPFPGGDRIIPSHDVNWTGETR